MLDDARLEAFIATADIGASRAFYEGVLGLAAVEDNGFAVVLDAGAAQVRLTRVPEVVVAPYTVLGWAVAEIAPRLRALRDAGVPAVRFDGLEQDGDGVWTAPDGSRIAWFRDPDGHVLSLHQPPA